METYNLNWAPAEGIHPSLQGLDQATRRGQEVARICIRLRSAGFYPDLVIGHPAWGDNLYVKDVFPHSKLVNYCEYFFNSHGREQNFDPDYPCTLDVCLKGRTANAVLLSGLDSCDFGISPTRWQLAMHPVEYQHKISVIFDGIDAGRVSPDPQVSIALSDGRLNLSCKDEVVTYVSRALEPMRGLHAFIRAIPAIQKSNPHAHIVIVGENTTAYSEPPSGKSYLETFLEEVRGEIDLAKVHFLGRLAYERYLAVLQISSVHIYLTYPFVLSWSMLEAMSAGCLVVGSRTGPVEEVIRDGHNGLLVDFFSPAEIAAAVHKVLAHPDRMLEIRQRARQTILESYDIKSVCLPQQLAFIRRITA